MLNVEKKGKRDSIAPKYRDITEDAIFRCEAGWCEFFIIAVWDWRDSGDPIDYTFAIIAEPKSFVDRIVIAWKALFGKKVYEREIILSQEKVNELRRILNKK